MIVITILGQIMGGKNNIVITRTGMRFPKPAWKKWRDAAVASVRSQLPPGFKAFTLPTAVALIYVAGDRRRRDMPAVIDSLWHCLERAGVVEDDSLLWINQSERRYDKADPRAVMYLDEEVNQP